MSDPGDISSVTPFEAATPEALAEIIIDELEQDRERLVNDTLATAQRAKIMKSKALETLEPNLAQIDTQLEALRTKQAKLTWGDRSSSLPFISEKRRMGQNYPFGRAILARRSSFDETRTPSRVGRPTTR